MKILIVEDEPVTARYIKSLVEEIFGDKKYSISIQSNLLSSECYLLDNEIDLLLLDLNLNGEDGFELLEHAVASSFHTIVISGNVDKALVAFEYGVVDFIPKPFDRERLESALNRLENKLEIRKSLKKISVRKGDSILLLPIESINFFEADGKKTKIHLKSGNTEHFKKNLNTLQQILPPDFYRVHKSYLVSLENIKEIKMRNENSPHAITHNQIEIPIARRPFKELQSKFRF